MEESISQAGVGQEKEMGSNGTEPVRYVTRIEMGESNK